MQVLRWMSDPGSSCGLVDCRSVHWVALPGLSDLMLMGRWLLSLWGGVVLEGLFDWLEGPVWRDLMEYHRSLRCW